jgi:hypothetical protein
MNNEEWAINTIKQVVNAENNPKLILQVIKEVIESYEAMNKI